MTRHCTLIHSTPVKVDTKWHYAFTLMDKGPVKVHMSVCTCTWWRERMTTTYSSLWPVYSLYKWWTGRGTVNTLGNLYSLMTTHQYTSAGNEWWLGKELRVGGSHSSYLIMTWRAVTSYTYTRTRYASWYFMSPSPHRQVSTIAYPLSILAMCNIIQ